MQKGVTSGGAEMNTDRQEIAQNRLDVAVSMSQSSNVLINPVIPGFMKDKTPLAKELLKPGTKEMYETCELQHTVYSIDGNKLSSILNDAGVQLYATVLVKVNNQEFKDTISDYRLIERHSGMWVADQNSPFHDTSEEGCNGCLNSWNNRAIHGYLTSMSKYVTTSPCIFITQDWCYTTSGSLYRLENKIE